MNKPLLLQNHLSSAAPLLLKNETRKTNMSQDPRPPVLFLTNNATTTRENKDKNET